MDNNCAERTLRNPIVSRKNYYGSGARWSAELSRVVCERLQWRRRDGRVKEMSCRVAMLRMQDQGLIVLPAARNSNANGQPYRRRTLFAEPEPALFEPAGALPRTGQRMRSR